MGLNFRKSISLGKGVKVNLGTSGVGLSFGVKGARYSVNTNGKRTATFGIPGTGLSYTKTFGTKKSQTAASKAKNEKIKAQNAKAAEKEAKQNAEAVEEFNEELDEIMGIHRDGVQAIDWNKTETIPRTIRNLQDEVLAGNIDAYYEVIEKEEPFEAILDFGSQFEIGTEDPKLMVVEFNVNTEDIVPETELKLSASGKLTEKEMSKSTYYDILQDYVCSVTIRVARDIFALLPVDKVIVHAVDTAINPATGNNEDITYLSVIFERAVFEKLNLDRIDPSDSLANFEHNMKFSKTTGFKPVVQLTDW